MPSPWPPSPLLADPQDGEPSESLLPAVGSRSWRVRGIALSYLVLVCGLAITTFITVSFVRSIREKESLRLQNQAAEIENHLRSRLTRHVGSLLGGAALFAVDSRVTMSEFRNFTQRLMRFGGLTGMQGLGFARRVAGQDARAYEYFMRRERPGFQIWPAGPREEHYPIEFLEPRNWRNDRAIGYDMFTDPTRREAMARARDTGEPTASGPLRLVQETSAGAQNGFLIYVPAYKRGRLPTTERERRESLIGFVYSPYRGKDFLDLSLSQSERERFAVSLYDGSTPDPARALHEDPSSAQSPVIATKTFGLAGRSFTLQIKAHPAAGSSARWGGVIIGTVLGVLVTVLLFIIMRFQVGARMAAERNAERLRQARREAVRSLRTRDAFLSIASHELKTPLTALQLQVDGLHRAFATNRPMDADRVQRRLESVRRQARRLTTLVDDLLDVSRLADGRLHFVAQPVNMGSLLRDITLRFETEAQRLNSPIQLQVKDDALDGLWDASRLDQVVTNLLSNALKYGAGQPVELSAKRQGDRVVLQVKDQGIGIAPEDQQRIFSRFERAVPDRNFGGFGLGLWICREIVAGMGGSITVASETGKGAIFEVSLPLQIPSVHDRSSQLKSAAQG